VLSTDVVARSGSDEFVVLVDPVNSDEEATAAATRILDALDAPFYVAGAVRHVSVSIGVSRFDRDDSSVVHALARADAAMYRAKAEGRGRVRLADAALLNYARRRTEIDSALNDSTQADFELHYQPIIDLTDGSIAAVEALLRWEHPTLGWVSPSEFIPIAESSGRILDIGGWVLAMAAHQAVAWEDVYGRTIKIFVNVAGNELTHPSFARTVAEALDDAGASGRHIALELTETALAEVTIPAETLDTLERSGIDLVLDDFGTGYSSLSYLSKFPITTIKLDRSFIASCSDDPASLVILDVVGQLASGLGLPALAEGIESAEQLDHVRARGYALAQGYFFARPLTAQDVGSLLCRPYPFAKQLGFAGLTAAARVSSPSLRQGPADRSTYAQGGGS
jgi:predicted signal transduction protein with EAL and GGDEF domain